MLEKVGSALREHRSAETGKTRGGHTPSRWATGQKRDTVRIRVAFSMQSPDELYCAQRLASLVDNLERRPKALLAP